MFSAGTLQGEHGIHSLFIFNLFSDIILNKPHPEIVKTIVSNKQLLGSLLSFLFVMSQHMAPLFQAWNRKTAFSDKVLSRLIDIKFSDC